MTDAILTIYVTIGLAVGILAGALWPVLLILWIMG